MSHLLKQLEVITVKPETAHEAMKIGRVIGGYYELSEEGRRIVEEAMLSAVQARFATREPVVDRKPEKPKDGCRKGQRSYTHAERQYLNSVFESNLDNYQAIIQAAGKLGRTRAAIERQLHVFMNNKYTWSEWIKGGKK